MTDRPWLASYPEHLQWDAPIALRAVPDILDEAVARWPDRYALDFMGRRTTYRELGDAVARAACGLQRLGVGPGVHVGLYLPNTPHYVIAFFAVLKAGGVVVNYSPLDAERVLEHKVADSETDLMVTLDLALLYPQIERLLHATRLKKVVVGSLGEMSGNPAAVTAQMRGAGLLAEVAFDDRHVSFAALLDNDGRFEPHDIGDPAQALAVLQYTGGTTGLPKGAMLTHGNLSAANEQYVLTLRHGGSNLGFGEERVLSVLPPFHIYSLSVNTVLAVRIGAESVLHTRFEVGPVLKDLADKKISMFVGVPTMYTGLIHHPDFRSFDLSSLKFCGSGGAPLPVEVHQRFLALTGRYICEGWGMTETSPSGTFTPSIGASKPGSCGLPMPGDDIRLADLNDASKAVPLGEPGELCIAGPNVMKGYWKNPQATADSFTADGFFRTGDVATMDADGWLRIVDRTKDMLLCSGFNVYPRIIEEAIYEHPSVAEACVIGIPDDYRGQTPKAFIALKPGAASLSLDDLQAFLQTRIGKHEMVSALEIRSELPRTMVGKLSKKTLVDEEAGKREALSKG
ncbi:MAG: dicarboxylate--CoA ligase PimA [Rhizobacter sp.]|nr:dicarboxylate--CoA ligase PimA [Rhizobacter sp.]